MIKRRIESRLPVGLWVPNQSINFVGNWGPADLIPVAKSRQLITIDVEGNLINSMATHAATADAMPMQVPCRRPHPLVSFLVHKSQGWRDRFEYGFQDWLPFVEVMHSPVPRDDIPTPPHIATQKAE